MLVVCLAWNHVGGLLGNTRIAGGDREELRGQGERHREAADDDREGLQPDPQIGNNRSIRAPGGFFNKRLLRIYMAQWTSLLC